MSFIKQLIFGASEEDPTGLTDLPSQENAPDPLVEGIFYPRTLYKFNGHDDEKIFIAIRGRVFDCTTGRSFYGPSGPYANFAGKDASRGLALNSFELDVIRDWNQPIDRLHGLDRQQRKALNDWLHFFEGKYPVIGTLVSEPDINDPVEDSPSEDEQDYSSSDSGSESGSESESDSESGSESNSSDNESESDSENASDSQNNSSANTDNENDSESANNSSSEHDPYQETEENTKYLAVESSINDVE